MPPIECLAESIYSERSERPGWKPWVPGGNSHAQDEARRQAHDQYMAKSVREIGLPTALSNAIYYAGIATVGAMCVKSASEWARTRNIGRKSIQRIAEWMDAHGMTMEGYQHPAPPSELVRLREENARLQAQLAESNAGVARICAVLDAPENAGKLVSELYQALWDGHAAR